MVTVRHILKKKGTDIWSTSPDATVLEALQEMAQKNVGALVVLNQGKLVGIFSERDYARKLILKGKFSKDTAVKELMTSDVVCVEPHRTLEECLALMTQKHIRHLPVLEDDRLVGIVTIGDVGKQIIADQQFVIRQLEKYVTGT